MCRYRYTPPNGVPGEWVSVDSAHDRKAEEDRKLKFDDQGRAAWLVFHAKAEHDEITPEWLDGEFRKMIPSYGCGCVEKWEAILAKAPLMPAINQKQWAIDRHNDVNWELGKPLWRPTYG